MPFVSKLFPKWHCKRLFRTDPLKALVIGGFVRGPSMRDIESLCEEVGLGRISRSMVARICAELHERFEASKDDRSGTPTSWCCRSELGSARPAPADPTPIPPAGDEHVADGIRAGTCLCASARIRR